jgi:hypothetical protein
MRHKISGTASIQADLTAAALFAAVLTQLLFAQFTLVLAACLVLMGRLARWRPIWLALPAVAGLTLVLAEGPGRSLAGYLAVSGDLIRHLSARGPALARLAGLRGLPWRWERWLPRQFPAALLVASGEAALAVAFGRRDRSYRPGAVALARRRYVTMTLRRGEVSTADGGCLGIVPATGRRVTVSWREAEGGVLCTGLDPAAVTATALGLAIAAIQHRKTVITIDLGSGAASRLAEAIDLACAASAAPLVRAAPDRPPALEQAMVSALARREVVLVAPDGTAPGERATPVIAGQIVACLLAILTRRAELGAPADCLVWLDGCEAADPRALGELVAAGGRAGTAVLVSTAAHPAVASIASQVNVLVVRGPAPPGLASAPESLLLERNTDGLALFVRHQDPGGARRAAGTRLRLPGPRLLTDGRAIS